jgi:hypothetical protein
VPIAKSDGAALGFQDIVEESKDAQYEAVLDGDQLGEIDAGTPAQIVEDVKYLKNPTIFKIRTAASYWQQAAKLAHAVSSAAITMTVAPKLTAMAGSV